MSRPLLLLVLAGMFVSGSLRADCELLYASPEVRTRLLAFHYTNELRRAREREQHSVIDGGRKPPAAATARHRAVPAGSGGRTR
ncbi:hypothetical protein ACFWZ4_13685 [Frateuria sp. GZRe12]|uniref:hypothetical protein n=1 Tax=Frateuria sp. GZRe12 TaxID=3351533 RepID=UPI003EDB9604